MRKNLIRGFPRDLELGRKDAIGSSLDSGIGHKETEIGI